MISGQVETGFRRRDTEIAKNIFYEFCEQRGNQSIISNERLLKALDKLGVHVQASDLDEHLQEFDFTGKIGLDLNAFLSVLQKPTIWEEWVKSLPVPELIADAIPNIPGAHPLKVISIMSALEISVMCKAILSGLEKILLISSLKLKDAFNAMANKPKLDGESKFSLVPMTCGTIKDFHRFTQESKAE